ncbi:hypothetical protein IWX46DRAFT_656829, partial [Phyllosticta citricarpa]
MADENISIPSTPMWCTPMIAPIAQEHFLERRLADAERRRAEFEAQKLQILSTVEKEPNVGKQIKILIHGHRRHCIKYNTEIEYTRNIIDFLEQANVDQSVSASILEQWRKDLSDNLDMQSDRYHCASLFGQLIRDWIQKSSGSGELDLEEDVLSLDGPRQDRTGDAIDKTDGKDVNDEGSPLEKLLFTAVPVDKLAISKYLQRIFEDEDKYQIDLLRKDVRRWSCSIDFNESSMAEAVAGILRSGLFSGKKMEQLCSLQASNDFALQMIDIVKSEYRSLDVVGWGRGVPLRMRKQLDGHCKPYMDEKLSQALVWQFLGSKFAVSLREVLKKHADRNWITPNEAVIDHESIAFRRADQFERDFFLANLPPSAAVGASYYGEDDLAATNNGGRNLMEIKQTLLRLLNAEMLLNVQLHEEFTVLTIRFDKLKANIPHETVFTVLEFLKMPYKWTSFIKTFLEAPLILNNEEPDAEGRPRQCGVPEAHVLSDAICEAVLYCLDYAVNVATKGTNLYRCRDGAWIWGQESTVIEAWKAIQEFSSVMGLKLDMEETAATKLMSPKIKDLPKLDPLLPKGPVRWGLLVLDPMERRFTIDETAVNKHLDHVDRQLSACRSVLSWAQVWNQSVVNYFSLHLGKPEKALGREHINDIIATFDRIQHTLFSSTSSTCIADHLRAQIFSTHSLPPPNERPIPDAFFFFPHAIGGLELRNPFIAPYSYRMQAAVFVAPSLDIAYAQARAQFDAGDLLPHFDVHPTVPMTQADADVGWTPRRWTWGLPLDVRDAAAAFALVAERSAGPLARAYKELVAPTEMASMLSSTEVSRALRALAKDGLSKRERVPSGFATEWTAMDLYWRWIVALYASEAVRRCGGLQMAEGDLLDMPMMAFVKRAET